MPASCTLRLNRLSASSNESPEFTKTSVMKFTSAIAGRLTDHYFAFGNNHCNTQAYRLVAQMAPVPRYHN
jgi:hypothetical protein